MENEKLDSILDIAADLATKADKLDQVLIIYRYKKGVDGDTHGSLDNELTLEQSLWMVEAFKFWLQAGSLGLLKKEED